MRVHVVSPDRRNFVNGTKDSRRCLLATDHIEPGVTIRRSVVRWLLHLYVVVEYYVRAILSFLRWHGYSDYAYIHMRIHIYIYTLIDIYIYTWRQKSVTLLFKEQIIVKEFYRRLHGQILWYCSPRRSDMIRECGFPLVSIRKERNRS